MHIQDLPIETFKVLLQHVARALNVESALRLRLVSSTSPIHTPPIADFLTSDARALRKRDDGSHDFYRRTGRSDRR